MFSFEISDSSTRKKGPKKNLDIDTKAQINEQSKLCRFEEYITKT